MDIVKNASTPLFQQKLNTSRLVNFMRYYSVYRWILHFYNKKGRILDFGCGKGELVFYCAQKGYQAYGVDPHLKPLPSHRTNAHPHFLFNSLSQAREQAEGLFDMVILNFSLEHLRDPIAILKELHAAIATSGFIFIRVPNSAELLKNKKLSSFQIRSPEHRYFFTKKSLVRLLRHTGFSILRTDTRFCIAAAITAPCSIFPALDPMLLLYGATGIISIIKAATLGMLTLLFLPYTWIKCRFGHGIILHVVAKK